MKFNQRSLASPFRGPPSAYIGFDSFPRFMLHVLFFVAPGFGAFHLAHLSKRRDDDWHCGAMEGSRYGSVAREPLSCRLRNLPTSWQID